MKPKPKDLLAVVSLAIIAGWSGASALMAFFIWPGNPEEKKLLIEGSKAHGFIFMPPLFGTSRAFYVGCTTGLAIACFFTVLHMRLKKNKLSRSP